MKITRNLILFVLLLFSCINCSAAVTQLTIDGPITPATLDYLKLGINTAKQNKSKAILIQLNTPGGLLSTTQDIVKTMLDSPIATVVYVAPKGAQAASAGTFLVYASDIAVMAPGTRLGAATPVTFGGDNDNPMIKKATEDTSAWIRSLAEMKNRHAAFGEAAVKDAQAITAKEALSKGVIEYIANDTTSLLSMIDSHKVDVAGENIALTLKGETIKHIEPSLKMRILSFLADPNIAYLLLLAGLYGLLFELMSPGNLLPGVVGAICITIAAYSLYILPVNHAGLILVILGVGMLVGEIFTSGIGILAIGGVIALMIGGFFMINRAHMSIGVALDVLIASGITFGVLIGATASLLIRSRRTPLVNSTIGHEGLVTTTIDLVGEVVVKGENWRATADSKIQEGEEIVVVSETDLTLHVEKK